MKKLEKKIPPPLIFLAVGLLMWLLRSKTPSKQARHLAWLPLVTGIGLIGGAFFKFGQHKTTADPQALEKASALVTSGVYRYTRNPMYLGLSSLLEAWAWYLSSPLAGLGIPMFMAYIQYFQIRPEERALQANFGADYTRYKAKVRRWV